MAWYFATVIQTLMFSLTAQPLSARLILLKSTVAQIDTG